MLGFFFLLNLIYLSHLDFDVRVDTVNRGEQTLGRAVRQFQAGQPLVAFSVGHGRTGRRRRPRPFNNSGPTIRTTAFLSTIHVPQITENVNIFSDSTAGMDTTLSRLSTNTAMAITCCC